MREGVLRWWVCVWVVWGVAANGRTAFAQERAPTETISLRELLKRALAEPPRVLAALASLERARAEEYAARASYLPTLTLQVSEGIAYDNRQQVPNALIDLLNELNAGIAQANNQPTPPPASQSSSRLDSVSAQTSGSANLDWSVVNAARRKAVQASKLQRKAEEHGLSDAQRVALSAASELFVRALSMAELVADAELTHERRSQQHQGIAGLVKAGLRPPVDETRARIEAVAAHYRLQTRRIDERAAYAALAASVGRDPRRPLRPEPIDASPFSGPSALNEAIALTLEHRPELQRLERTLQARQAELRAAYLRRLPTLGISGVASASYIDQLRGQGYQGSQYSANALGYLRWQGLDASVFRSAAVARANMLSAQRALEVAWLDAQAEVADASFAVERTQAELARATEVLTAAQATREAQNGRYKTGVASLLELLDAEGVEQNARLERIQAARDHEIAKVRLLTATGLIERLAK